MKNMVYLRTCIGVKYDLPLLKEFLKYYKELGVNRFFITLSALTSEEKNIIVAKNILAEYDIKPAYIWLGPYEEEIRERYLNKMVEHLHADDWVLTVDCDEFQEYPIDLNLFINKLNENHITYVQGGVVDRVTNTGHIPLKLDSKLTLSEQFPVKCNMHRLKAEPKGGVIFNGEKYMPKVMLHKKHIKLSWGNHIVLKHHLSDEKKYTSILKVNHFKWFGDVNKKMIQLVQDDINNPSGKEAHINHLQEFGKINLSKVMV